MLADRKICARSPLAFRLNVWTRFSSDELVDFLAGLSMNMVANEATLHGCSSARGVRIVSKIPSNAGPDRAGSDGIRRAGTLVKVRGQLGAVPDTVGNLEIGRLYFLYARRLL